MGVQSIPNSGRIQSEIMTLHRQVVAKRSNDPSGYLVFAPHVVIVHGPTN